ncbi:uncharacterized protein TRIVIDRAFT_190723 [Trichoderma virens Gv29-8]|uniref:N-acetyltransferase ESCO zinc-finger domain-containing protein n=1 Tax=Hypocrea virens (strain Gv29-8 / FGSC 10586) TaxID=413071 RepID=G9MPK7_HYPVG|nr:uncharacterized protein TRIVIDRAFT_190723 [Trichoderma virens Gv29-8]EHK23808.1 hypothetical protein TRIVIDRAFT_190723 [Trichoderma virens Gv29-8]
MPPRTKPGLHHHLRKRDKPLRTYGRQTSTPEAQSEPPLKRPRLAAIKQHEEKLSSPNHNLDAATKSEDAAVTAAPEAKTTQDEPSRSKPDTHAQSPKKGSILSYFKPAPQKPKDDAPSQPQDSQSEEPIAPQASPKRKHTSKRKPRLLKIKAISHEPCDQSSQDSNSDSPQPHFSRHPLQNTTSKTAETTSSSTSPTQSPGRGKPGRKPKPSPSIQTTLNISAQAPFSECKICNTVWNPLYPDDVKFHNKTHKAVLRAQKRKVDDL